MGQRNYTFDAFMQVSDGAAAYTSNGIGQVSSANKILDLGGAPTRTDISVIGGMARIDAAVVVDVSAMVITTNDDIYTIYVMGSNNSNGSNPVVLGAMNLGYGSLIPNGTHSSGGAPAGTGSDSYPGRYEILFSTEQADINYEYVYLYNVVAGTGKSITYTATVVVLPEE